MPGLLTAGLVGAPGCPPSPWRPVQRPCRLQSGCSWNGHGLPQRPASTDMATPPLCTGSPALPLPAWPSLWRPGQACEAGVAGSGTAAGPGRGGHVGRWRHGRASPAENVLVEVASARAVAGGVAQGLRVSPHTQPVRQCVACVHRGPTQATVCPGRKGAIVSQDAVADVGAFVVPLVAAVSPAPWSDACASAGATRAVAVPPLVLPQGPVPGALGPALGAPVT